MPDASRRVVLSGAETPVFLHGGYPLPGLAEVEAFEKELGHRLPDDYREFLLRYNGGDPVVSTIAGRDDDPRVGYAHDDGVQSFHALGASVPRDSRLLPMRDSPWARLGLPRDALVIADDPGGNPFVMSLGRDAMVRFFDHEAIVRHRIVAESFLDLLMRFRTIDEEARIRAEIRATERTRIEHGPLPSGVREALEGERWMERAVRRDFLRVFDSRGYFELLLDEPSFEAFDLLFWIELRLTPGPGLTLGEFRDALSTRWRRTDDGPGFGQNPSEFLTDWWASRRVGGAFVMTGDRARFTPRAEGMLRARCGAT